MYLSALVKLVMILLDVGSPTRTSFIECRLATLDSISTWKAFLSLVAITLLCSAVISSYNTSYQKYMYGNGCFPHLYIYDEG